MGYDDANRETTHDADWQHGLDHGGFKSDGDGVANDGSLTVESDVLHNDVETTHDEDWQHGMDHGGFKSDGDGVANDDALNAENALLHEYRLRDTTTTHNPEWQHGLDHGGFKSDGDGVSNGGVLFAEDSVLHNDVETTHDEDWQHGLDHGGLKSDGDGVSNGDNIQELVVVHNHGEPRVKVTANLNWILTVLLVGIALAVCEVVRRCGKQTKYQPLLQSSGDQETYSIV